MGVFLSLGDRAFARAELGGSSVDEAFYLADLKGMDSLSHAEFWEVIPTEAFLIADQLARDAQIVWCNAARSTLGPRLVYIFSKGRHSPQGAQFLRVPSATLTREVFPAM